MRSDLNGRYTGVEFGASVVNEEIPTSQHHLPGSNSYWFTPLGLRCRTAHDCLPGPNIVNRLLAARGRMATIVWTELFIQEDNKCGCLSHFGHS